MGEYFPASHALHEDNPTSGPNHPARQKVHADCPSVENVPNGHCSHTVAEVACGTSENNPAAHREQLGEALELEYVPAWHELQVPDPLVE